MNKIMTILIKKMFFGLLLLAVIPSIGLAQEKQTFGKLFFTPQQRQVLDEQRATYYGHVSPHKPSPVIAMEQPKQKKKKSTRQAPDLSLSSIIITPEGKLLRLNGKYVTHARDGYQVKSVPNANQAKLAIKGKAIRLQVGETYVPAKKKALKNYATTHDLSMKNPQKQTKLPLGSTQRNDKLNDRKLQRIADQLTKLKKMTE